MILSKVSNHFILLTKSQHALKGFCAAVCQINTATFTIEEPKRRVPVHEDDFKALRKTRPIQPENPHRLKVSILGEPNAGKSTLTNSLVRWKVCSVSKKVHTTRRRSAAVLVQENKQIVFLDTPGLVSAEHSKKHSLEPSFVMDPMRSVREADLIAVIIDVSNKYTNSRISPNILEILSECKDKKSILVLNKIDAMKSKDRLLHLVKVLTEGTLYDFFISKFGEQAAKQLSIEEISDETNKHANQDCVVDSEGVEERKGWPYFSRVFMVSALRNNGVEDLRNYLLSEVVPGNWPFSDNMVTDQHPHEIALMTVREKLLEYLPQEIPYAVDLYVASWEILSTGCPKINIKIKCNNARHKRFVIGPSGKHIAACVEKTRLALRESFRKDVVLNIGVV
ncbi:GTPase Era, mitochondrial-like [Uloborus diversus]|uniref:GTPase Era, mitochondrial-like n=1 Tax=Uloborus diversus TaxID=327109 RepID=UPI00240966D9|nr:GTPase Era, mitochondrial-like [Uloborus diversus]